MFTLSEYPELTAALQNVLANVVQALGPQSEGGKRITKTELLHIVKAAGHLLVVIAKALET